MRVCAAGTSQSRIRAARAGAAPEPGPVLFDLAEDRRVLGPLQAGCLAPPITARLRLEGTIAGRACGLGLPLAASGLHALIMACPADGYSVGRWDGDTLVVESNNFRGVDPAQFHGVEPESFHGVGWLDHRGSPYSLAMTLTERFRRVNYGQLEIEMTVDDPQTYTRPFTLRIGQQLVADGSEIIEFICHENQMFQKLTGRAGR